MTKHTSWAIALTATTFLSAPAMAASLAPTLEQNSAFSYSEGSENDYNFTLQEPDADGKLTTKYYKIDLKPEAFLPSGDVTWSEVEADKKEASSVVAVPLFNGSYKYFKYTYTQPEGKTVYSSQQNSLAGDINADFVNSTTKTGNGGAISNPYDGTIGNITGNIIGNRAVASRSFGGAIYNRGTIGDIRGTFIGNKAISETNSIGSEGGGAFIYNQKDIGNINGDIIGNVHQGAASSNGGAIYNPYGGTIKDITGTIAYNKSMDNGTPENGGGTSKGGF